MSGSKTRLERVQTLLSLSDEMLALSLDVVAEERARAGQRGSTELSLAVLITRLCLGNKAVIKQLREEIQDRTGERRDEPETDSTGACPAPAGE